MIKRRLGVYLTALFVLLQIHAFAIDIGLFSKSNVKSVLVTYDKGNYHVISEGDTLFRLANDAIVRLSIADTLVKVQSFEEVFGYYKEVKFVTLEKTNNLRVKSLNPEVKIRKFDGNLIYLFIIYWNNQ